MSSLIQQLISDGSLVLYHDYRHRCAHDFSGNGDDGVLTDTAWTGRGISFPASTSLVTVPDDPAIRLTTGALVWFNGHGFRQQGDSKLISKQDVGGVNYELGTTPTQVTIYDGLATRTLAVDIIGKRMIGVNLPPAGGTCEGFIDTAPGAAFSGVSTFTEDDADLILGNLYSGGHNFDDMSQKVMIINRQLTATEHSQLYGELSAMGAPTKVISRLKDFDPNELVDGDMEEAGTAAWSAGGGVSVSKDEMGARHGLRWLKVSKMATGFGFAHQSPFTAGKRYLVRGYARGDGVIAPVVYDSGAALIWAGVASTTWQYFEKEHTAVSFRLDLASLFASAGYVGFDDIRVTEIGKYYPPVLTHSDWGANQSAAAVTSGQLENTPFEAVTGSFKIVLDTLDGELIKSIECITNGTIQFPAWLDGLDTGWTGYEDTGSGYALNTLSLSSLVYTMTAGDKIALSDRAGNHSIVKV